MLDENALFVTKIFNDNSILMCRFIQKKMSIFLAIVCVTDNIIRPYTLYQKLTVKKAMCDVSFKRRRVFPIFNDV